MIRGDRAEPLQIELVEFIPDQVWTATPDGRLDYVNRRVLDYFGVDIESVLGDLWGAFVHPDDLAAALPKWRHSLDTGDPYEVEFRLRRSDGAYRRHVARALPMRDDTRIVRWYGTNTDIESQRLAEDRLREINLELQDQSAAELRKSQARLAEAQRLAGVGSGELDLRTGIVTWSDEAFRIHGLDPESDPLSLDDYLDTLVLPEDAEIVREAVSTERPAPQTITYRIRRTDGVVRVLCVQTEPVSDDDGLLTDIRGTVQDVTERITAEEERARVASEISRLRRLETVGRLASSIAHDFNNLLAVIMNYAYMVGEVLPEGTDRADLREIEHAAERGAALVQQLLTFSGRSPANPEPIELNAVVADLEGIIRTTLGAQIGLLTELTSESTLVEIDVVHAEQAIINVVVNARDAMEDGGLLTITTERVEPTGQDPQVRLRAVDTGVGMSEDVVAAALEPFYSTKPPNEGTGLGLATVHGVLTEAGGQVALRSTPGAGTEVTMTLPAAASEPAAVMPPPSRDAPRGAGTVLVVEDEAALSAFVCRILKDAGYECLVASTGAAALTTIEERKGAIDLVVSDVVMPGMSGHDLADRLREREPRIPVLLMSGFPGDPRAAKASVQNSLLLPKPFSSESLLAAVDSTLAGAAGRVPSV